MTESSGRPTRSRIVRDVVISIAVLVGYPWLLHGVFALLHIHPPRPTIRELYALLFEAPLGLAAAVLVTNWKWWRRAGWRTPVWRQMWLLWVPGVLVARAWIFRDFSNRGVIYTALAALFALAVGFTEETWFRGLLFEALRCRGELQAVVLSAAAFGLIHLNGIFRGFPTVFQVFSAFGFGLMYGAARIRIGAIWPLVLLHAAQDLPSFLVRHHAFRLQVTTVYLVVVGAQVALIVAVGFVYANALVVTRPVTAIESANNGRW